jgi:hypothetical protein
VYAFSVNRSVGNQEDKKNPGYENVDNDNVAASLLMQFHCSGKEIRLQELYEFPESTIAAIQK